MKKIISITLALVIVICSFSCYAYAETTNSDVAAKVEELRNDPIIQEMVERYAPDPEEWWVWFEELPLDADTGISKFYVLDWVEYFASIPEEERLYVSYNPLNFAVIGPDTANKSVDDYDSSAYAVVDSPDGGGFFQQADMSILTTKICGAILYVKKLIAALLP